MLFVKCSFVAENWQYGWMGQFMWGVFNSHLKMESSDIIAMTPLNFTNATDPKNPNSVYFGSSSFTRCVWEIRQGNVVRSRPQSMCLMKNCKTRSAISKRPLQIRCRIFASATFGRLKSAEE
jgi:hypothetical protein